MAAAALPCTNSAYECVPSGVFVRSYSDPTGVCTWTLTVNWGDGSAPVVRTLAAGGSVTVWHTYRAAGFYTAVFDFPPGSSSDPEQTCLPLHEEILIEVPKPDTDGDKIADDEDNCPQSFTRG